MSREFVVTDEEGNVSWNAKTDKPETFKAFRGPHGAEARAKELAEYSPGKTIRIYELTAKTIVPLKPVETSRIHPTEHYN